MTISYENLELIPELMKELQELKDAVLNFSNKNKPKLNTVSAVADYLNVSKMTVYNMLSDGRFKENVHFTKQILKNKVKIIFVESAIIKYKENL